MNFGEAIIALKEGKRVSRQGWNGKGLFIFQQVPSQISIEIVPKMQSLPQSVKDEFIKRAEALNGPAMLSTTHAEQLKSIRYTNQLAIVYPDNTVYGWVASPSDILEEDWCVLD